MTDKDWFESLFIKAAGHFGKLQADKISDWEIGVLKRAIDGNLLSWDDHLIRVSSKKLPYSIFTMNREYLIQFAAYALLIYEYGYPAENCLIEESSMDIMVKKNNKAFICVETKVKLSEMKSLLKGINECSSVVVPVPIKTKNDSLAKANYIFSSKASYFWLLNDNKEQRWAFSVEHHDRGFILSRVNDIPKYNSNNSATDIGLDGKQITKVSDQYFEHHLPENKK